MPPRKSTSSIPPTDGEEGSSVLQSTEQQLKAQEGVSVEDLLLPRSVTQRLAKNVLPPNTTIQKDALLAIQKAATVFVSYLSSHANEATLKRTIAPSDVLSVLSELEFDSLHPRLQRELDAHTAAQAGKKRANKEKKETAAASEEGHAADTSMEVSSPPGNTGTKKSKKLVNEHDETARTHGTKRVKRDSDKGVPTTADDTEVEEEQDDDETEEEDHNEEEEEEEEEEEDEGEEDDDSDGGDETQEAEDLDRVEDLDQRDHQAEDNSDSEDDEDGPAAQLRSNMGLG